MNFICAVTIFVNLTNIDWTKVDKRSAKYAAITCRTDERYSDTPCLKKFVKVSKRNYHAICGYPK